MKKIFAFILASLLTLSLVSCGAGSGNTGDDYDDYDEYEEGIVEEINMYYGDDKTNITLYKPENASFAIGEEEAQDAGDLVVMTADDYSWDAEIMGYKYYGDSGLFSNKPFVDYYFSGIVSDEYTYFDDDGYYTDLEYEGSNVVIMKYVYEKEDYDEPVYQNFVGFEYEGSEDRGLMGCMFNYYEDFEDEYFIAVFAQTFGIDYDYQFETESYDEWDDWDDEEEGFDTDMIVGEWENADNPDEVYFFFADDYATLTIDDEEAELSYVLDEDGVLTLEFEDITEEYIVSFDGSDTMYFSDGNGHSIELYRI